MKGKLLHLLLIVTSLFGYMEWGLDRHSFLFEAEYTVLKGLFTDFNAVAHPFTLIPLLGQLLLLINIFLKKPKKLLTYLGIGFLGLLLVLLFVISLIEINLSMLVSTLPFILVAIYTIRYVKTSSH